MHGICYAALGAIHFVAAVFAAHVGATPEAVCANSAALVYAAMALGAERRA